MRHILFQMIAGASLLAFCAGMGMAQDRDREQGRDSWYRARDTFYQQQHWKAHMFQRVREDLDRVQADTFPGGGDEYRIARTKEELGELQGKLATNRYDQPELDDVIAGMQRVIDSNKLRPRDRDVLNDDLARLREYREHHEDWR